MTDSEIERLERENAILRRRLLYFVTELAKLEHREALDALATWDEGNDR